MSHPTLRHLAACWVGALIAGLSTTGCVDPENARTAWLVEQLHRDNRVWSTRDPSLLSAKYARMAADPYDYMRGTNGVFLRDQERPGTERVPTAFLTEPHAADVLLMVDPHPENVGGFLPGWPPPPDDAGFRLDFNDFDGASHGPWIWDVRRGALGLAMLVHGIPSCDDACRMATIEAFAQAHATAVLDPQAHDLGALSAWGEVVERRAEDLIEKGRDRDEVSDQTERDEDRRLRLVREALEPDGRAILDLTPDEQAQVDRLVRAYTPHAPEGFRLLDAVRRYGRGIASIPAIRYVWLWDQGDDGTGDDRLFQVREVVDPPAIPGLSDPVPGLFGGQADRVRAAAEGLWAVPASDALLVGLRDGAMTFKVASWTGYSDGFDHEDIQEDAEDGKTDPEDLVALGRFLGALLGGAHQRGLTAHGRDAGAILRAELEGRVDAFLAETTDAAATDLARTLETRAATTPGTTTPQRTTTPATTTTPQTRRTPPPTS